MLHYTILFYIILYNIVPYYAVLYHTTLYCTVLYCTIRWHGSAAARAGPAATRARLAAARAGPASAQAEGLGAASPSKCRRAATPRSGRPRVQRRQRNFQFFFQRVVGLHMQCFAL